jgi:hypothetical protein
MGTTHVTTLDVGGALLPTSRFAELSRRLPTSGSKLFVTYSGCSQIPGAAGVGNLQWTDGKLSRFGCKLDDPA